MRNPTVLASIVPAIPALIVYALVWIYATNSLFHMIACALTVISIGVGAYLVQQFPRKVWRVD
jgi:hypothetical protein